MDPAGAQDTSPLLDTLRSGLTGRYAVLREIGRGGMAVVFLADDLKHGRQVAVKVLRPEIAASVGPERFLREISISAHLHHPHILPLYDSGAVHGLPYYVMPYVTGPTLRDRIARERQLPIDDAVRIASEVADALAYAHGEGVVHRDIKPQNILLDGDHALVADFGIAKAVAEAGGERLTETGIAVGTPAYMSPEQSTAQHGLDGRSDVYSLGCVLFEMLGGTPPFVGVSAQAMIARHLSEPPPSLQVVRPTIPDHVARAVAIALAKVPADRFASARQFADALVHPSTGAWASARQWIRRGLRIGLPTALLATAATLLWNGVARRGRLDPDEIVVFPFAVTGVGTDDAELGQSVALAVTWALNTTASLRAVDGWQLLDAGHRAARAGIEWDLARAIASSRGAGRLVTGSVLVGDSVRMLLDLYDVRRGTRLHRTIAAEPRGDPWALGLQGAGDLIRTVTGGDAQVDPAVLTGHSPAALEQFLQGERAYRQARFVEAFDHYRDALASDSGFALAALRAAQAARWSHRERLDAGIVAALAGADALPARYAAFARGLRAYGAAQADSAVAAFQEVIALDPEWHEAWMALGEVYTHLLPAGPPPDSMAAVAFRAVRRLDPDFTPVLYHLIQIALRAGRTDEATGLLEELRRAEADTLLVEPTALLVRCASRGPPSIDWSAIAADRPGTVSEAGQWFTTGGLPYPDCAEAAWRALLAHDTTRTYTFAGLVGLENVLMARGRYSDLLALHDADTLFDPAQLGDLEILAVTAGAPFADRAREWADSLRALAAVDSTFNTVRLWFLGVWEVFDRRPDRAQQIVDRLLAPAALAGAHPEDVRLRRMLGGSLAARIALARGDSARAFDLLTGLRPSGGSSALRWYPWESLGAERLMLADLLLARGAANDALRVARFLDAPGPIPFVMFLPRSLQLRITSAGVLGYAQTVARLQERLTTLTGEGGH